MHVLQDGLVPVPGHTHILDNILDMLDIIVDMVDKISIDTWAARGAGSRAWTACP